MRFLTRDITPVADPKVIRFQEKRRIRSLLLFQRIEPKRINPSGLFVSRGVTENFNDETPDNK